MWCDAVGHARKDYGDFAKAIRANVVYLWNGRVHASKTRREETDCAEKRVQEVTGWSDLVEEKIVFVEAVC